MIEVEDSGGEEGQVEGEKQDDDDDMEDDDDASRPQARRLPGPRSHLSGRGKKDGKQAKKKRQTYHLNLMEKFEIVQLAEKHRAGAGRGNSNGLSYDRFIKEFLLKDPLFSGRKVSRPSVLRAIRQADLIRRRVATMGNKAAAKRSRVQVDIMLPDVEEGLFIWFEGQRKRGFPVTQEHLRAAARVVYGRMYPNKGAWEPSNGWMNGFKARHCILGRTAQGKSEPADVPAAEKYRNEFVPRMRRLGFDPACIYNADETGLFFRQLPDKTLSSTLHEAAVKGHKKCKQRLTVLLTCNATGTHKVKLFVIGTAKRPQCFRGGVGNTLPVEWGYNKMAWMTWAWFEWWLTKCFIPEVRKKHATEGHMPDVLLTLDNFSGHGTLEKLAEVHKNVPWLYIEFLPPNTTSIIQPMDGGIIAIWKRLYRKLFLERLLAMGEADKELTVDKFVKRTNVLHAIQLADEAWKSMDEEELKKVWDRTLMTPTVTAEEQRKALEQELASVNQDALSLLAEVASGMSGRRACGLLKEGEEIDKWMGMDDLTGALADPAPTPEDAADEVMMAEGDEGEDDSEEEGDVVTSNDALRMAILLKQFFEKKGEDYKDSALLQTVINKIQALRLARLPNSLQSVMTAFLPGGGGAGGGRGEKEGGREGRTD